MEAVIHLPDVDIHDARAAVFPVRMGVPLHVEPKLHRFPVHTNLWNRDYDPRFDLVVTARFTLSHYDYFSD